MGDGTLVLSTRRDSGESEGDGIHTSRRCDLYRQHIQHIGRFSTYSRCDQLKSSCLATPLSQSLINMTAEMTRLSCSPISVEIRIPSSSSGSERKPTILYRSERLRVRQEINGRAEIAISFMENVRARSGRRSTPHRDRSSHTLDLSPAKEGMKSFKRALGRFGHFGRISTEIPARIHCL